MCRSFVVLMLASILTGCVGIWTDFTVVREEGLAYRGNGDQISIQSWKGYDKNSVLKELGEPDEVVLNDSGKETWIYPYKTAWKGIYLLAVIVPVPLKAPVGTLNFRIDFDGNTVYGISHEYITGSMYACGPGFWLMTSMSHSYEPTFCGTMD